MRVSRLLAMLAVLLAVPFLLAACGGDDGDSDEDTITDVIESSATSSDPADCTELQTVAFNEQTTGESGDAAIAECEADAEDTEGDPDSVEVASVEVDGDAATAEVTFNGGDFDGSTLAVSLVKEDDQWKLDAIDDVVTLDAEAVKASITEQVDADAELTAAQKTCITDALNGADDATIEAVLLGDQEALAALFEGC